MDLFAEPVVVKLQLEIRCCAYYSSFRTVVAHPKWRVDGGRPRRNVDDATGFSFTHGGQNLECTQHCLKESQHIFPRSSFMLVTLLKFVSTVFQKSPKFAIDRGLPINLPALFTRMLLKLIPGPRFRLSGDALLNRTQILLDLPKGLLHLFFIGNIACVCLDFDIVTLAGGFRFRLILGTQV